MSSGAMPEVERAEVVVPCGPLPETLSFFTEQLGFRLEAIFPAEEPTVAVVSGHGVRLRLVREMGGAPGLLRLSCRGAGAARSLVAPNGMQVELVPVSESVALPPLRPALVLSRAAGAPWTQGRAGMHYRDLIPGRLGGRYIASQIRISEAGPVADYPHFHAVAFQLIYCARGWARLAYEGQGPAFLLQAGDCVLQPPRIRHRVLEASGGFEAIEVGAPAEHETHAADDDALAPGRREPGRLFGTQRFHHHRAVDAAWARLGTSGIELRDLGLAAPSGGVGDGSVLRTRGSARFEVPRHHHELHLGFVLAGSAALEGKGPLEAGDAFVIPAGQGYALTDCSPALELLRISVSCQDAARPVEAARPVP